MQDSAAMFRVGIAGHPSDGQALLHGTRVPARGAAWGCRNPWAWPRLLGSPRLPDREVYALEGPPSPICRTGQALAAQRAEGVTLYYSSLGQGVVSSRRQLARSFSFGQPWGKLLVSF